MAIILDSHRFGTINFGAVFNAPGACGFVDEPFFHTPIYKMVFKNHYSWDGATKAFKTTPVDYHEGNMPLSPKDGITPKEKIPRCIAVNFLNGHVLNAVMISSPGVETILAKGVWQIWPEPFVISFAAVDGPVQHRLNQADKFVDILKLELPYFRSPVAVHLNFGCPNLDLEREDLYYEVIQTMHIFRGLNIPLIVNFGPTVEPKLIASVAKSKNCNALWLAGTFPWDELAPIVRLDTFGSLVSPLTKRGFTSGGLSGPRCLPFALHQLREVRALGITKPIVAGGGIQSIEAARSILMAQADGLALGVIATIRPWRLYEVIQFAKTAFI